MFAFKRPSYFNIEYGRKVGKLQNRFLRFCRTERKLFYSPSVGRVKVIRRESSQLLFIIIFRIPCESRQKRRSTTT